MIEWRLVDALFWLLAITWNNCRICYIRSSRVSCPIRCRVSSLINNCRIGCKVSRRVSNCGVNCPIRCDKIGCLIIGWILSGVGCHIADSGSIQYSILKSIFKNCIAGTHVNIAIKIDIKSRGRGDLSSDIVKEPCSGIIEVAIGSTNNH